MSGKELELELVATLSEAVFGHGYMHYGYWPDGLPEQPTLQRLSEAQQAYFDLLVATIPDGTRSILDVGSGSGANALGLSRLGYRPACLSPSERLNAMARAKLPAEVAVHTTGFEAFTVEEQYDLCLFAESFHYIALDRALAQIARYARRHVLIMDYFRRSPSKAGETGRTTHRDFREALDAQGAFVVRRDEDVTASILPTFEVIDHLRNRYVAPLVISMRKELRGAYPFRSRLADLMLRRTVGRLERPGRRAERFRNRFEYRLILLERS